MSYRHTAVMKIAISILCRVAAIFTSAIFNARFCRSAWALRVEVPPNAGPQARRWQLPGTPQLTARDAHEKRGGCEAAPAASLAGQCWAACGT